MEFSRFLLMLLVTTTCAVVLSVCIGVSVFVCPISSRAWRAGMDSLQLMKISPSSASAADDITSLTILALFATATLLGGNAKLFYMENFSPALLLDFVSER